MKSKFKSFRRGGAVVEMAVILPVLAIITFGIMECMNTIHTQQSLTICAYEGARVTTLPNTNSGNVVQTCNLLL
ncbi:MAG: TadE family protein [Planctomycetota bacterium]